MLAFTKCFQPFQTSTITSLCKIAYLVIEKKDVYMLAGVYDKVFDGTDVAQIKTPVVSGLVDKNITLSYDKK